MRTFVDLAEKPEWALEVPALQTSSGASAVGQTTAVDASRVPARQGQEYR